MPNNKKDWRLRIEPGTTFRRRGQRYEVVGFSPHECRDGRLLELVRLASHCPDCDQPFEALATRRNVTHGCLTRRCVRCARPGVPVGKTPLAPPHAEATLEAALAELL